MNMNQTLVRTLQLDGMMAGFSAQVAWMHANKIDRVFVGECYVCEWSNSNGNAYSCEIPNAPEIIRKAWGIAQEPLRATSHILLKKRYHEYNDWDRYVTFLDSIELSKDQSEWLLQARVWFQINRVGYGICGSSDLIETEGHVNWRKHLGQSWKAEIKACTHIEDNAF